MSIVTTNDDQPSKTQHVDVIQLEGAGSSSVIDTPEVNETSVDTSENMNVKSDEAKSEVNLLDSETSSSMSATAANNSKSTKKKNKKKKNKK